MGPPLRLPEMPKGVEGGALLTDLLLPPVSTQRPFPAAHWEVPNALRPQPRGIVLVAETHACAHTHTHTHTHTRVHVHIYAHTQHSAMVSILIESTLF